MYGQGVVGIANMACVCQADKKERVLGIPLLLHACCGPCSLEPVRLLREEGFEPTICWVNPNIQPEEEYNHRLTTLQDWAAQEGIPVLVGPCDRQMWEKGCSPLARDRMKRCRVCYSIRLDGACRVAVEHGFKYIATTLAVSPYQLLDICNAQLERLAKKYDLIAVPRDFTQYYPQATKRSRELGMYRQNYCGCRFSALEASLDRAKRHCD